MSVEAEVRAELEAAKVPGWQQETLLALARVMDDSPNASAAKELWARMDDLGASPVEKAGDPSDELAARRAERRSARQVGS